VIGGTGFCGPGFTVGTELEAELEGAELGAGFRVVPALRDLTAFLASLAKVSTNATASSSVSFPISYCRDSTVGVGGEAGNSPSKKWTAVKGVSHGESLKAATGVEVGLWFIVSHASNRVCKGCPLVSPGGIGAPEGVQSLPDESLIALPSTKYFIIAKQSLIMWAGCPQKLQP
jgi:hypothetical protein